MFRLDEEMDDWMLDIWIISDTINVWNRLMDWTDGLLIWDWTV